MATTTFHELYHRNLNYNYSACFTWWDRWMGTENPEYQRLLDEQPRPHGPEADPRPTP